MSREDHNDSPQEGGNLNTEPIHGVAPAGDPRREDAPSDATLPSDEPRMLAERESGKVVKICKTCMISQRDGGNFCVDCGNELVPIRSVEDNCIGEVVGGKFTIVEKIGSGGMGEVYRGINEPIDQQVAIKFLNEKFTSDEKIVLRFLNEARSYCKVNHPNAVTLLEYGQHDDGSLYLITEFIEGDDLTEVVRRKGPLSTETIVNVGVQMCEVLSAAHSQGIIHRDLKPDNLMLITGTRGRYAVKVLDFGIAKIADDDRRGPMTETGSVFGTPEFMSPEQARGDTADPRSDLYALGAILYYMATAKLPFRGKNKFTVLNQQLNDDPTPPSQVAQGVEVHPDLEAIILQCLAKSAEERPATADEVAELLEDIDLRSQPRRRRPNKEASTQRDEKTGEGESQRKDEEEILDGPAGDEQDRGPLGMSTFDEAADEPLEMLIDDEDGEIDPLGVTLGSESGVEVGGDEEEEDLRGFDGPLDTEGPGLDVELSPLERQYASRRRRTAVLGALATLLVLGGIFVFSKDSDEAVVETEESGLEVALSTTSEARAAALLKTTERFVDKGHFSEADTLLEVFNDIAQADSPHREHYDAIVNRASQVQNLEMRVRSNVEAGDCDRASTLLDNLEGLSAGAADERRQEVNACTAGPSPAVAEAPSSPSPPPRGVQGSESDAASPSQPAEVVSDPDPQPTPSESASDPAPTESDEDLSVGRSEEPGGASDEDTVVSAEVEDHEETGADEDSPSPAPDEDEGTPAEVVEASSEEEETDTVEVSDEDSDPVEPTDDDADPEGEDDDVVLPPSEI